MKIYCTDKSTVDFLASGQILRCCETTWSRNCFSSSPRVSWSLNFWIKATLLSAVSLITFNFFTMFRAAVKSLSWCQIWGSLLRKPRGRSSASKKQCCTLCDKWTWSSDRFMVINSQFQSVRWICFSFFLLKIFKHCPLFIERNTWVRKC